MTTTIEWVPMTWIPMATITAFYSITLYSLFPLVDDSVKAKSCLVPFINTAMGITFAAINILYYYNSNDKEYFEKNDLCDFMFLIFVFQGIYWDIIFGLSYYKNELELRIFELTLNVIAIITSCFYNKYRLLSLFWLTFVPDLIKNTVYIFFYNQRKNFELFYGLNVVSYKLTLPIVFLYNISQKTETMMSDMISIFILSCYTFYQFSHFVLWNLESINNNYVKKQIQKVD